MMRIISRELFSYFVEFLFLFAYFFLFFFHIFFNHKQIIGVGSLSSNSMRRDYYRGSQDSLAIRGNEESHFMFFFKF